VRRFDRMRMFDLLRSGAIAMSKVTRWSRSAGDVLMLRDQVAQRQERVGDLRRVPPEVRKREAAR